MPSPSPSSGELPINPDFNRPLRPIAELLQDPGFPKTALGEFVDIGGYTGVVVQVVNQSLRVRSPDGATKSFNSHGLRRIYGPRVEPVAPPSGPAAASSEPVAPESKPAPAVEPNFEAPIVNIADLVKRPDYPQCLLGAHVQIGDYTGVVIQILNRSLKVRSRAETTRSYNADALRKLHGL